MVEKATLKVRRQSQNNQVRAELPAGGRVATTNSCTNKWQTMRSTRTRGSLRAGDGVRFHTMMPVKGEEVSTMVIIPDTNFISCMLEVRVLQPCTSVLY